MKRYSTEIEISAPCETVWRVLTEDMPRDPEPFGIIRLEGAISLGSRIKLWSEVSPKRAFALTVTEMESPNRMVWKGGMPLGLFTGRRSFILTGTGASCLFQMKEVFSGPLSGMISKSIPDLTPSFVKFAQTLKSKAEQK